MERDDDSTTTLHVWLLVATTFILTFSLKGFINPFHARSSIHLLIPIQPIPIYKKVAHTTNVKATFNTFIV
jgi:hypothetical protein